MWDEFSLIAIKTVHSFATWKYHCLKANNVSCSRSIDVLLSDDLVTL